jgi:AcrR family transcriptional regulator
MTETTRRKHRDGEENRRRILAAATEVAGERGYDGTSIALVSERSGLPASSIYWNWKDKDALIAAVIEDSFNQWLAAAGARVPGTEGASRQDRLAAQLEQTAKAILSSPHFLRLGLMLTLERRPDEPTARTRFLEVRAEGHLRIVAAFADFFPELDDAGVRHLATFAMAAADGLFIAYEVDGDDLDLLAHFDTLAVALLAAADHLTRSRS